MTTLQLNQELFKELTVISSDEDKLRQAISALRTIALGIRHGTDKKKVIVTHNSLEDKTTDWDKYFANTPVVDFPKETETLTFTKAAKGRTIKQMKEWL